MAEAISKGYFGRTPDGHEASLYVLCNRSGMKLSITNFGGIVTSMIVPDKKGHTEDVVLGFTSLEPYLRDQKYFGAVIGRYGNRIDRGFFVLDGEDHRVAVNNNGHHLHGGPAGFDKRLWKAHPQLTSKGPQLQLTLVSPDGDQGFPGRLDCAVTYTLSHENQVKIEYRATTNKPTHVNLTNHSYFNLAGHGAGVVGRHLLAINADGFSRVNNQMIPTGEIRRVEGTPLDFRQSSPIGQRIESDDQQVQIPSGYDHTWVLNKSGPDLSPAAVVHEPSTGRVLEVLTTEPGLHFYSANFLEGELEGKAGATYRRRGALCLETQHFPDSPNKPHFPTTILRPGEIYQSTTVYRFLTEKAANHRRAPLETY